MGIMPQGARVDSLDALTLFKSALIKFQEAAQIALSDAEGEMNRVLLWVETEQQSHWQNQIRKCQEAVVKCKEAVRMKKIFKDASGRQQSAVDEEKALTLAVKRLAEAEGKLAAVKRWSRQLQREIGMYKGGVQRFVTTVETEIPHAAAHLEGLMAKLDAYLSVQPAAIGDVVGAESSGSAPSMARGGVAAAGTDNQAIDAIPRVPQEQRASLATVEPASKTPDENLSAFITLKAQGAEQLILRRDASGWLIGPADPAETRLTPVHQLLQMRPDLAELLSLPVGFSVIMDDAGAKDVLDPLDHCVWSRGTAEPPPVGTS
jgi:hypothetical protein